MTVHVPEAMPYPRDNPPARRRPQVPEDRLVLSELNPDAVVDCADEGVPLNLITYGKVREVCPKCKQHL